MDTCVRLMDRTLLITVTVAPHCSVHLCRTTRLNALNSVHHVFTLLINIFSWWLSRVLYWSCNEVVLLLKSVASAYKRIISDARAFVKEVGNMHPI